MAEHTSLSFLTNPEAEELRRVSTVPDWFKEIEAVFDDGDEDKEIFEQVVDFWIPAVKSAAYIIIHNTSLFRELIEQLISNPSVEIIQEKIIFKALTLIGENCANILLTSTENPNYLISNLLDSVEKKDYDTFHAIIESNKINLNPIERTCNVIFHISNYYEYLKGVGEALNEHIDTISDDQLDDVMSCVLDKFRDTYLAFTNHKPEAISSYNIGLNLFTDISEPGDKETDTNADSTQNTSIIQLAKFSLKQIYIAYGQYNHLFSQTEKKHILKLSENAPIKYNKYIRVGESGATNYEGTALERYQSYIFSRLRHDKMFIEISTKLGIPVALPDKEIGEGPVALPAQESNPEDGQNREIPKDDKDIDSQPKDDKDIDSQPKDDKVAADFKLNDQQKKYADQIKSMLGSEFSVSPNQLYPESEFAFDGSRGLAKYVYENRDLFHYFVYWVSGHNYIESNNRSVRAFARTITGMKYDSGKTKALLTKKDAYYAVAYLAQCGILECKVDDSLKKFELNERITPPPHLTKWGQKADREFIILIEQVFGRYENFKKPKTTKNKDQ